MSHFTIVLLDTFHKKISKKGRRWGCSVPCYLQELSLGACLLCGTALGSRCVKGQGQAHTTCRELFVKHYNPRLRESSLGREDRLWADTGSKLVKAWHITKRWHSPWNSHTRNGWVIWTLYSTLPIPKSTHLGSCRVSAATGSALGTSCAQEVAHRDPRDLLSELFRERCDELSSEQPALLPRNCQRQTHI